MKPRSYRWDTGLRVRVLGLVLFLFSLVVGLGAALSQTLSHVEELQLQVERTRQNVLLMEQITGNFSEMTSGVRGFVLVGEEPFLNPYASARNRLEAALTQLRIQPDATSEQAARLRHVDDLVSSWLRNVAEPEIAAKRAGKPDVGRLVASGGGLSHIDELRAVGKEYSKVESDRLNDQIQSARNAARNLQIMTWAGTVLAGLLVGAGFLILARQVTGATGALAAAAEAVARGERGVVVKAQLDGELLEVAEAFTAMSMTLAAQEQELTAQQEEMVAQNEQLMAQQEELHHRTAALELRDARLSRLNRMGEEMIGTLEVDRLCRLILDEYLELYSASAGAFLVADPDGSFLVHSERWLSPALRGARIQPGGSLARCLELSEVTMARYPQTITYVSAWHEQIPAARELYVPLLHMGRVLAVVVIASDGAETIPEDAQVLGRSVARQSAMALTAAQKHLEVRRSMQSLQEQAAQVEELNAQLAAERDRASAQLEIYLSIVSTMQAGAWLTDARGNPLVVNATFRNFFGGVPGDAGPQGVLAGVSALLPPGDPFPTEVKRLVNAQEGTGEGTLHLSNGYVLQWFSAPVGPVGDPIGRLFTFQDITELAKLDRLKSEFVNTVSHELRTPLTSIMGYLSLVLNEQVGSLLPEQKEFLEVVSRNTTRLGNLINDVLDIQRIESGRSPFRPVPVSLAAVVRQVTETYRVNAEQKGLGFEVAIPPEGVPPVMADPDRMAQIAGNLINNALKYTREGGVRIGLRHEDGRVALTVEDTGIGMTAAERERIFEKFFRSENKYAREAGGTGLGLAIVKALVDEHRGQIIVESTPGKGSCFTVLIPLMEPAQQAAMPA